jgi:hypothetical protein
VPARAPEAPVQGLRHAVVRLGACAAITDQGGNAKPLRRLTKKRVSTNMGFQLTDSLRDLRLPGFSFALVLLLTIIYIGVGNPTVHAQVPLLARGLTVLLLNTGLLTISAALACNFVTQHDMLVEESLTAGSWLFSTVVVVYSRFIRKQTMVPVYVRLWWTLAMGFSLLQLHNHSCHSSTVANVQVGRAVLSVFLAFLGMCESPPRTFDVHNPLQWAKDKRKKEVEGSTNPGLTSQTSEGELDDAASGAAGEPRKARRSGESVASLLSTLTFHWMTPLLQAGGKSPLVFEQIYDLEDMDQAQPNMERLYQAWTRRVEHAHKRRTEGKKADPSLTGAIHEHQMYDFWLNGLLELMQDGIVYAMPNLIHGMIEYAESNDQPASTGSFLNLSCLPA